ncbi:LysR family transcriptional regulator [Variovorax sp. E3]|uniref:LysR family transcriptional regulator n=1 Tax=Variovorax sp. E3 TaxID=1914993 RepID=UPI0035AE184D
MIMRPATNNLTLRHLRAFMAVARNRSFVAAAKELFVSPSALSETIRQVEEDLDIRLLDRTTRSVEPTAAGEEFYADIAAVLESLDACVARMGNLRSARLGRVRITGVASVMSKLAAPCIAQLLGTNPGISFEVAADGTENIMSTVLAGTADIGFGVVPAHVPAGLHVLPLLKDRYVLLARKDHEAHQLKRVTLKSVEGWTYAAISFGEETARSFDQSLHPTIQVDNFAALVPLLDAGACVTVLPYLAAESTMTEKLALRAIEAPAYTRSVSLIRRESRSLSPAAQLLWDLMVSAAPKLVTRGTPPAGRHLVQVLTSMS